MISLRDVQDAVGMAADLGDAAECLGPETIDHIH